MLENSEQCDLGAANGNRPAFQLRQGAVVMPVIPVRTDTAVHVFYDYRGESSHTGYEATGHSRIMLHVQATTGSLSLVMHHGQDVDLKGKATFAVKFSLSGLPVTSTLAISDDAASEFSKSGSTAQGDWRFSVGSSDGGALGALPFPGNWTIKVTPEFAPQVTPKVEGYITHWDLVNGDKSFFGLSLTEPIELIAYDAAAKCNANCTVPRCGDGVLDGGEKCDDGNVIANDGCGSDCKALR
jgi:cysteine-rich repeat protein